MQSDIVCSFYVTTVSLWVCGTSMYLMTGTREALVTIWETLHTYTYGQLKSCYIIQIFIKAKTEPSPTPYLPRAGDSSSSGLIFFRGDINRSLAVTEANQVHLKVIIINYFFTVLIPWSPYLPVGMSQWRLLKFCYSLLVVFPETLYQQEPINNVSCFRLSKPNALSCLVAESIRGINKEFINRKRSGFTFLGARIRNKIRF